MIKKRLLFASSYGNLCCQQTKSRLYLFVEESILVMKRQKETIVKTIFISYKEEL